MLGITFITAGCTLFVLYLLQKLISFVASLYYLHQLPGPPSENRLIGNMLPLMDTPEQIFRVVRNWGRVHYPIYKLWIGPLAAVNLLIPEDMAIVLSDMKHNKKSYIYHNFSKWLGTSLLLSDGQKWVQRRKMLTPAFHFKILQGFIPIFNEKIDTFIDVLKEESDKEYTEVTNLVTHFALDVVLETILGQRAESDQEKAKFYENAIRELAQIVLHRTFRSYLLFDWIFILLQPRMFLKDVKLTAGMHRFTRDIIVSRERDFHADVVSKKKKRLAMLDLLLTIKKTEGSIDHNGIREEVDGITFEGHDTISSAISFGLMLIACHPRIQDEIVEEMKNVLGNIKKKPNYDDLQQLHYMERCIKEVMRMYPSVHYISRELGEDIVTHTSYMIKKGTTVQLHIYDMHHNPEIYPDPEKFDPDRFLPENCKNRHPYAYLPFSAGPRNCIGQKFAFLELKAVFCGVLGNFILKPVDTPQNVVPVVDIVLKTKNEIKVKFLKRAGN